MENCDTCGAARHRTGVLYPVRRLCRCEKFNCGCGAQALVVEFQKPVKTSEEGVPAKYLCGEHSPGDFIAEIEKPLSKGARAKKNELPHIDPAWKAPRPPENSNSRLIVQCVGCKNVHETRERRMFNGTESLCPKCGERVWVYGPSEEEEAA
jgi:hypothetical protein